MNETMTTSKDPASAAGISGAGKPRRRSGKRLHFRRWPTAPTPVRALWDSASEEERTRAHGACAAILEWWLGRMSRQEVAARLEVGPIRAWQLSQQALAGMAAGLLRQPRARKSTVTLPPEQDPRALRKRLAQLQKELEVSQSLVELLRGLPGNRGRPEEGETPSPQGRAPRKRPPATRQVAAGAGGTVAAQPTGTDATR